MATQRGRTIPPRSILGPKARVGFAEQPVRPVLGPKRSALRAVLDPKGRPGQRSVLDPKGRPGQRSVQRVKTEKIKPKQHRIPRVPSVSQDSIEKGITKTRSNLVSKRDIHKEDKPEGSKPPYLFECPYEDCARMITVFDGDVKCGIFRCGIYKITGDPIPPHASKTTCEALIKRDLIYGCGRPFRFDGVRAFQCGYV